MKPIADSYYLKFSAICAALLILLFAYTALSKILDVQEFTRQMNRQVFPVSIAKILVFAIPASELIACCLLVFKKLRRWGHLLSLFLMLCFTIYMGLAVIRVFDRVPCSCGGVLQFLDFQSHLVLNIFFLFIALIGFFSERKLKAGGVGQ